MGGDAAGKGEFEGNTTDGSSVIERQQTQLINNKTQRMFLSSLEGVMCRFVASQNHHEYAYKYRIPIRYHIIIGLLDLCS